MGRADDVGPNAADWPLILADASQPLTLRRWPRAQVVLTTTVGPYTRYGLPLSGGLREGRNRYADLTGLILPKQHRSYHKQARRHRRPDNPGARIRSIPSDLNVYQLYLRSVEGGTGGM